jgi:hypothetical protein
MIQIAVDGRVLDGTPIQIVQFMRSMAFGKDDMTIPEYCRWAMDWAAKFGKARVEFDYENCPDDECVAQRFIDTMVKAGLATMLN